MKLQASDVPARSGPTPLPSSVINSGLILSGVAAVLLSVKLVAVKLLYRHGLDSVSVIALRMLFAAPFFAVVAVWTWRREPRPNARDLAHITGLGLLGFYGSSMLDFLALQYISAGLERVILFITPTLVLVLGLVFFGRAISRKQWLSMALAYFGIVLVFWHELSFDASGRTLLGGALVAMSATTYAVYLLLTEKLMKRLGTLRVVSLAMSVSCIACLVQYVVLRPFPTLFHQSNYTWWISLMNGSIGTAVPVFMTMIAVQRIGAGHAAQASMIGPIATLFVAAHLLDEPVSAIQLLGTALVTIGILLLSERNKVMPAVPPEN